MLGRGGILLCPRGFPAVTVRLKLRDGAAKSPCTCGLVSEIYTWRNKWMLKQSDYVVTYITHSWGGAAQFAEIAARQKKTVINLKQ